MGPMKLGLPGSMSDAKLCEILIEKGRLTEEQLAGVVSAADACKDGRRLGKTVRDSLMAIAMAQKLTERTKIKKHDGGSMNMGDPYSSRATTGTAVAEVVLARGRTPSGHMIVPPGRRTG